MLKCFDLSLAGQNLRMLNALTTLDTAEIRCLFESVSYFCRIMQQDQTNERQKYGKDEHENLETFSKDLWRTPRYSNFRSIAGFIHQ